MGPLALGSGGLVPGGGGVVGTGRRAGAYIKFLALFILFALKLISSVASQSNDVISCCRLQSNMMHRILSGRKVS